MPIARKIIKYSKRTFSIMLIPNIGKLVNNRGNTAQCIAQANDVVMPNASQLSFNAIEEDKYTTCATLLQNIFHL